MLRLPTILGVQVDKAEQDKQSAIIKAQGEATSARLIGEAIQQNPAFITLRKIEAARDIAGTISGAANKVFLSSDSLLLNLVSAWPCMYHPVWSASTILHSSTGAKVLSIPCCFINVLTRLAAEELLLLTCRVRWMFWGSRVLSSPADLQQAFFNHSYKLFLTIATIYYSCPCCKHILA